MKKIKLGNKGFTLVEVLVAAALVGGLAVVMMNIFKQQSFTQKKTEAGFELSTLQQSINNTLLNTASCIDTLNDFPNIQAPGLTLSRIKERNGGDAFQTGVSYGNLVEIQSINIVNVLLDPVTPSGKRFGSLELEFTFRKTSKILANTANTTKSKFKINIETNAAGNVQNCYSALESAVDTAKDETCVAIGGTFNDVTQKCDLVNFGSAPDNTDATSTKYLEDFMNNYLTNVLDPRYVNITGDTMTGQLTMNGAAIVINNSDFVQNGGNIITNGMFTLSDRTLKKNIQSLRLKKDQLYKLNGVQYFLKDTGMKDFGFLAQEVEKIYPELVYTNKNTGLKAVKYNGVIPLLVEEMKALKKENMGLKEENEKMKKDLDKIKHQLGIE